MCTNHLQELLRGCKVVFLETVDITAIEAGTRATRHDELPHGVLPDNHKSKGYLSSVSQPVNLCRLPGATQQGVPTWHLRNNRKDDARSGLRHRDRLNILRYVRYHSWAPWFVYAPACFQHIQTSLVVDRHVSVLRMKRPHQRRDVPYTVCSFASLFDVLGDRQVSLRV